MNRLDYYWYNPGLISTLLMPLSWLFTLLAFIRRWLYRLSVFKSYKAPVPVIIVGNITVGGTGKTPVVISLVKYLKQQGYKPGIVSRGYGRKSNGRKSKDDVLPVTTLNDPDKVGDEPVMLAQRCDCPIRISASRVQAVRSLLDTTDCDVIISDDGLQHYALQRDIEIVVIDGDRRFGNGMCLPAGPLREKPRRLKKVDTILVNGQAQAGEHSIQLQMGNVTSLINDNDTQSLSAFKDKTVHAIAGIGNPSRFFQQLRDNGVAVIEHPFADHYDFQAEDINFNDDLPVLMTEKDAVKCRKFANEKHSYIPVDAHYEKSVLDLLNQKLKNLLAN